MKVALGKTAGFQPFNLTITVETPEEAAELYALHNHVRLAAVTEHINHSEIRILIQNALGRTPDYAGIFREIEAFIP